MPGFGYAATSRAKVRAWTALIHAFLEGRANLARVYLLVDVRHGLKPVDDEVLETLDKAAVNYQIVLTKSDEVPPSDLASLVAETQARLAEHPAAFPQLVSTSARTGSGIVELRAAIARLLNEREHGGARAIGPMDG
jgi:GTP-binding protein